MLKVVPALCLIALLSFAPSARADVAPPPEDGGSDAAAADSGDDTGDGDDDGGGGGCSLAGPAAPPIATCLGLGSLAVVGLARRRRH